MPYALQSAIPQPASQAIATLNHTSLVIAAREVIKLALSGARRPVVTTKFGPHSAILLHLLTQEAPTLPVLWIDTGFNTRATLKFADRLRQLLDLDLKVFRPLEPWRGFAPELNDIEHARFTDHVKLEPFARALDEIAPDVWFSSLRRSQTEHRDAQLYFNNSRTNLLKVCPLIHWSDEDMRTYLGDHDLPSEHDYHDPTKGNARRECGLHLKY